MHHLGRCMGSYQSYAVELGLVEVPSQADMKVFGAQEVVLTSNS
jgi:hypothetical protein